MKHKSNSFPQGADTIFMTLKDIRELAHHKGVKNYSKLKKADLIRTIQEKEGNSPCYQAINDCSEASCLWRAICQD
jgi:Rho termination factor, N-terminal domain